MKKCYTIKFIASFLLILLLSLNIKVQAQTSLDFDGTDDYVDLANNPLASATEFTIEVWVYPTAHNSWGRILDFGDVENDNMFFTASHSSNTGFPRFVINVNNTGERQLTSTTALALNTWAHIAVTLTGTTATMYIDGVQVAQETGFDRTPADLGATTNNWLGRSQFADPFWQGRLDEVRIWNIPRTQTEIQDNMFVELTGSEAGLVTYYNFNEGVANADNTGISAPEIQDQTTTNNDGTLMAFDKNGANSNWVNGFTFVTTWEATGGSITIPTAGSGYDYSVTWKNLTNPGVMENSASGLTGDFSPTPMEDGSTYQILIAGDFPRIYFNNTGDKDKILTIEQWGDIAWTNMSGAFYGCFNLTYNATDAPDLSGVSDMSNMFRSTSAFDGDLSSWDVSNVTNMFQMFAATTAFNNGGVALNWTSGFGVNCSLQEMFFQADAFNQDVSSWDVSNVTDMRSMFRETTVFNNGGVALDWTSGTGTANVTLMRFMFLEASAFNQDVSSWDVINVTDMQQMFNNATVFNQSLASWDISGLTTPNSMENMLDDCGMDVANYDATLIGWEALATTPTGITLGASGLNYCNASSAVMSLTESTGFNWTITDAGQSCPTNALDFDGIDDQVTILDDPSLNFGSATDFTLEAWIQYSGSAPDFTGIIAKAENTGFVWAGYQLVLVDNRIAAEGGDGSTVIGVTEGLQGHTFLNDGTWHHVAMVVTRSANTVEFYVDGVLETSVTNVVLGNNIDNTSSMLLGTERQENFKFDGQIDEVRVWNVARSCDEINETISCELEGTESGLVAYYNFNQSSGTTLLDKTETNNGTLTNFDFLTTSSDWVDASANGVSQTVCTPATTFPEIFVQGNGLEILNGDISPDVVDDTDFGQTSLGAPISKFFTIENTGLADLNLLSVNLGALPTDFSIVSSPSIIFAGTFETVEVQFNPLSVGIQNDTLNVFSDDCDEALYTFVVQGEGIVVSPFYVNASATGANNGSSWADAYTDLQSALSLAVSGDSIYVAQGTYLPSVAFDFDASGGSDAREVTFQIPDGVVLFGGFAGTETGVIDQTVLDNRDFVTNETILSGDIGATGNNADNVYHIIYTKNVSSNTIVDGFTIRDGNANDSSNPPNGSGAGWYNDGSTSNTSNPTLNNIIFIDNVASGNGGGMYNDGISSGISSPILTNCSFVNNSAGFGGGLYNAAFFSGTSSPILTNCLFNGNTASFGGGIYNNGGNGASSISSPILTNCTFTNNTATSGGAGMYNNGNLSGSSSPQIRNSIFWNNIGTGNSWLNDEANPDVAFTLVEEASLPTGSTNNGDNILNQDPLFTDIATNDFTLQTCSPAINTGNNADVPSDITTDLTGNARIIDATVDMGAYEAVITATPEITVLDDITLTEIVNGDNTPDVADNTDFGQVLIGGTIASRTFRIENAGDADLTISSNDFTGSTEFLISSFSGVIASETSETFQILFNPSSTGIQTITVEVISDDCDEPVYTFDIQAEGVVEPEINVPSIPDGSTTISTAIGTDFGELATSTTLTYTIENLGNADLNISDIISDNNTDFVVSSVPTLIPALSSATFDITFNPSLSGVTSSAIITIFNDDSDESEYDFLIQGTTPLVLAPTMVSVEVNNSNEADVIWLDNANNETDYIVERREGTDGIFNEVALLGSDNTNYTDLGLSDEVTYFYRVRAVLEMVSSEYSQILGTVVNPVTANENFLSRNQINIYPNPSLGESQLLIEGDYIGNFEIYLEDMQGRSILEEKYHKKTSRIEATINLTEQAAGQYLIKIITDEAVIYRKIIKE